MNEDAAQRRRIWPVVCAAMVVGLPLVYVAISGPIRGYGHRWGISNGRFKMFFAPLVWLDNRSVTLDKTVVERALAAYWRLFPAPGDHLARPLTYESVDSDVDARAGVADDRPEASTIELTTTPTESGDSEAEVDGLTRFLESSKMSEINRNLGYEPESWWTKRR